MITLKWQKCTGEIWCPLATVNLAHPHFEGVEGVYIIWHGGTNPAAVYVGKGLIKERLLAHRTNPQIQEFSKLGLFVTWAIVLPVSNRDGIEAYLIKKLDPKVPGDNPNGNEIEVNLPW